MGEVDGSGASVAVNRAPVLTLWGAVVAERLGHERDTALTLGKVLAGLNAQTKGRMIGVYSTPKAPERGKPRKTGLGEDCWVTLCGRPLPAKETTDGLRACALDVPQDPRKVEEYLRKSFGDDLERVWEAMKELAGAYGAEALEGNAYALYERFRPAVARGKAGWGQKGTLDLTLIRELAEGAKR